MFPVVIKCDPCRHVQHHKCQGHPGCNCQQCWADQIRADARRRYETANTVRALRIALGEMLALDSQKARRVRKTIYAAGTVPFGSCLCRCGQQVWGSPYGTRKLYLNPAHELRAWRRRRKRELERQQAA